MNAKERGGIMRVASDGDGEPMREECKRKRQN
jgi:hypothetical protein